MLGLIARSQCLVLLLGLLLGIGCPKGAIALTWTSPPILFNPGPSAGGTDLVADPMGDAFTTWTDFFLNEVQVSRFSAATGTYGPVLTIYTVAVPSLGINAPKIATDASQTALVAVQDFDANQMIAIFYDGTTWQAPVPLYTFLPPFPPPGFNAQQSIAMDGSGNGLLAFKEAHGPTAPGDIIVTFFNAGTQTWGSLQTITPAGTGGQTPNVGYSANGDAVAVWLDGANNVIASNYNGATWTAIPLTISATPAALLSLSVGIDAAGNAVAIWSDNGTSELFSSSYIGGVWSVPQSVSMEVGVTAYDFAMSSGGTAIAVWTDGALAGQYSIYSAGTWSSPVVYNPNTFNPTVAIDTVGNALLIADDGTQVFSYTLPFGGPLSTPDLIGVSSNVSEAVAAYADNGRGFISETVPTSEGAIVVGTFSNARPIPGSISGRTCKNKFPNASERVKIITWTPFSNPLTVSYYLRRNGKLIAIIPASGPFNYTDHKRCKNTDVYVVTSVDAAGVESNPLTVSIK